MRASFIVMFVLVAGCSGSDFDTAATADATDDSTSSETSATDTGTVDTATVDSSDDTTSDSTADSGKIDTGVVDTGMPDMGSAFPCGAMTCTPGNTCVRTHTSGGACFSCDGGCPAGQHCAGSCCVSDTISYSYACKPTPAGCTTLSCGGTCATVCSGGCPCESGSPADHTITCHCLAP